MESLQLFNNTNIRIFTIYPSIDNTDAYSDNYLNKDLYEIVNKTKSNNRNAAETNVDGVLNEEKNATIYGVFDDNQHNIEDAPGINEFNGFLVPDEKGNNLNKHKFNLLDEIIGEKENNNTEEVLDKNDRGLYEKKCREFSRTFNVEKTKDFKVSGKKLNKKKDSICTSIIDQVSRALPDIPFPEFLSPLMTFSDEFNNSQLKIQVGYFLLKLVLSRKACEFRKKLESFLKIFFRGFIKFAV